MAWRNKLCFALLVLILPVLCQASLCYSNFTTKIDGPLYPLDAYGLSGRFTGCWSNNSETGVSYQLWMLTYDAATPKSFFLALVGIHNPIKLWDLTLPVVLWTARQARLVGINATLTFSTDGELKLDEDGVTVWSSNTTNRGVRQLCISNNATVMLTDYEDVLWQSSDKPTDTVLITRALKNGTKLVSWNSTKDPSDGLYSLEMTNNGLTLLYHLQPYWRFAASNASFAVFCWSHDNVSLQLRSDTSDINGAGLVNCSSPAPSVGMRLRVNGSQLTNSTFVRITPDGDMVLYSWNTTGTNWVTYFNMSTLFKCFLPLSCGRYGTCNATTGACEERCPKSFIKKDSDCEPPLPLEVCQDNLEYSFIQQEGADYFFTNYTSPVYSQSVGDCQERCNLDCKCTAAFYSNGDCFLTKGIVQSLKTGKYVALLKVAQMRKTESYQAVAGSPKPRKRFPFLTLGLLIPVLVLMILCLGWQLRRKKGVDDEGEEESTLQLSLMSGMPRRYTYEELEEVTDNFSDILGRGGFGSVFRGRLGNGTEVAVKKLEGSNQTSKDFFAEVGILATTHHWNLVKLLGFCAQGPRKRLLVYEYMKNGSLEQWIFEDEVTPGKLSWEMRFNVALGAARGLSYLHNECAERIIHLDLKPENVLLNSAFEPKIADFGLSKLMDRTESYLQLTIMRGTPGYVAPECLQEGIVTDKSDVFSFGVLLLEITTGSKSRRLSNSYLKANLVTCGSVVEDAAALLLQQGDDREKARLHRVAALCVQDDPNSRPPMNKVVQMMEGVVDLPQLPSAWNLHFFLAGRASLSAGNQHLSSDSSFNTATLWSDRRDRSFNKLLQNSSSSLAAPTPDAR